MYILACYLNRYVCLHIEILLSEVPLEGKEKKRKKVLPATKIQTAGDKSKSILDYVAAAIKPLSNNQSFIGEHVTIHFCSSDEAHRPVCIPGKRVVHMKKFSLCVDNDVEEASLCVVPVGVKGARQLPYCAPPPSINVEMAKRMLLNRQQQTSAQRGQPKLLLPARHHEGLQ